MAVAAQLEWIRPHQLSHFFQKNPLLDWLDLYGEANGFVPDTKRATYDKDTDFSLFLWEKAAGFRAAVFRCLTEAGFECFDLSQWSTAASAEEAAARTLECMRAGTEIIFRGTLVDEQAMTVSTPDLLVRSDVLCRLTRDSALSPEQAKASAFGGPWHYRVVDCRFGGLAFKSDGESVMTSGSIPGKTARLLLENRALARAQGFAADEAYLLGRSWSHIVNGEKLRGTNCLEKLALVDMRDTSLNARLDAALAWIRKLRAEGADWHAYPSPSVPELWPNCGNRYETPWHHAQLEIAQILKDPALLWQVGVDKRDLAVGNGIRTYDAAGATAAHFGVNGAVNRPVLDKLLAMIQKNGPCAVLPHRIEADRHVWGSAAGVEFYVDFETVSNIDDDFSRMPDAGGQPLIFMIGCGHMEQGKWSFSCFIADDLTEASEAEIIDAWLAHMSEVRERLAPGVENPLCFHWSPAEDSSFLKQYNSACARQPEKHWPSPRWYDFLNEVVKKEPVIVKDALSFSLKPLAKAMFKHGLIQTEWSDGPGDGLAAMVGAWRCHAKAKREGCSMSELPLMQSIARYNEVDCKVMQEIVAYLRANH